MGLTKYLKRLVLTLVVFLSFDSVWLGLIAPDFYRRHIGSHMLESPNLWAAGCFYLVFISGLLFFVVDPCLSESSGRSFKRAFLRGGFFGFCTYATFDLTCQALFKDWPTIVTVVDLAWGTILCASVSALLVKIQNKLVN